MSRPAGLGVLLGTVLALPTPSGAVPPSFCRENMVGFHSGPEFRGGTLRARLRLRDDVGDVSFTGPIRCTSRSRIGDCLFRSGIVDGFVEYDLDHLGGYARKVRATIYRRGSVDPACTLAGRIDLMWKDCMPTVTGTITCDAGTPNSVSGAFGLVAEDCRSCFHPHEPPL
jgi:hypothetical protein